MFEFFGVHFGFVIYFISTIAKSGWINPTIDTLARRGDCYHSDQVEEC